MSQSVVKSADIAHIGAGTAVLVGNWHDWIKGGNDPINQLALGFKLVEAHEVDVWLMRFSSDPMRSYFSLPHSFRFAFLCRRLYEARSDSLRVTSTVGP